MNTHASTIHSTITVPYLKSVVKVFTKYAFDNADSSLITIGGTRYCAPSSESGAGYVRRTLEMYFANGYLTIITVYVI